MHKANSIYWPQLDGLRTLAFLLVFLHHYGPPPGLTDNVALQNTFAKISEWGWLGVDLFFILSAFLVTYLLGTEQKLFGKISLPKFYARRALRIWPLFFLVLTITCFVYPMFAPHKASHLYANFLRDIVVPLYTFTGNFALPIYFNSMLEYSKASGLEFMVFVTILTPFWSLCIEEQFYLLWGLSARVCNSLKKLLMCASVLLLIGIAARFFLLSRNREIDASTCYYMNSLWHLEPIMLGAILALVLIAKPDFGKGLSSGALPPLLLVVCVGSFLGTIVFGPSIHSWSYWLAPMMTALSVAGTVVLLLSLKWTPLSKVLSNKLLVQIGKLTFGMYVFHFFVTWLAKTYISGLTGIWGLSVCFGLTFLAALVSWRVLEKPMNDMRRTLSVVHVRSESEQVQQAEIPAVKPESAQLVAK